MLLLSLDTLEDMVAMVTDDITLARGLLWRICWLWGIQWTFYWQLAMEAMPVMEDMLAIEAIGTLHREEKQLHRIHVQDKIDISFCIPKLKEGILFKYVYVKSFIRML